MWILQGTIEGTVHLFDGSGWTQDLDLARKYENPDAAQMTADGLHYAACEFNPVKAKQEPPRFIVRNFHTGDVYQPQPFVDNKFIYARRKK